MNFDFFLSLALSLPATVYGLGERKCGQVKAVACRAGLLTSSGVVFDPKSYQAALPAPNRLKIRVTKVHFRAFDGACVQARVVDRKNPRYVGRSGLDLSPGLVERLTGHAPTRTWSGIVKSCTPAPRLNTGTLALALPRSDARQTSWIASRQ